jgi:DNA-binding NtrC family response regulator
MRVMTRPGASFSPRVLVVDDEVDICRNLADILGDLGYEVDIAFNGERALELVRLAPYDVALLDLRMPGMDGLEVYRRIKELRAGIVGIIVTAYASNDTAAEAIGAGAWKVISKPVRFARLLELVNAVVDQPLILVVDDDRDLCANLWDLFRSQGFRVALAHDPASATKALDEQSFAAVVLDLKFPRGNGGDIFRYVREAHPGTCTIVITGYPAETVDLVDEVLKQGASSICYKPIDVPKLVDSVRACIVNGPMAGG